MLLPERLCAVGYAEAKLGDKPNIDELIAWTHKQGYSICGDIYATLRIVYKKENGERWGVHEFFLPRPNKRNVNRMTDIVKKEKYTRFNR